MLPTLDARRAEIWGILLGLSIPLGWLLIRIIVGDIPLTDLVQEVKTHSLLYGYLTLGPCGAFAWYGSYLGLQTERLQRMQHTAKLLSHRDSLTGFANRRHLKFTLIRDIACIKRTYTELAYVMVDLDHFKEVNDHFGHPAGDQLLIEVAKAIDDAIREGDFLGRYGGDEFGIILSHCDRKGAFEVCSRIQKAIQLVRLEYEGHEIHTTLSMGVAFWQEAESYEGLINRADKALYEAKQSGRNRFHLDEYP
jgi:diguanylate cyclase (GGDEF)-like protein